MFKPNVPYGYPVDNGYMGYVPLYGKMILFATEGEYLDFISE